MDNSNNGFVTSIWGPMLWSVLHIISLNYPVNPSIDDQARYYDFIQSLSHVLPCGKCRDNMAKTLLKMPLHKFLGNRDRFSAWMYDFHNEVNGHEHTQSLEEVKEMYELFRAKCDTGAGCIKPLNNIATKCVLAIIPRDQKIDGGGGSLFIDDRCFVKRS